MHIHAFLAACARVHSHMHDVHATCQLVTSTSDVSTPIEVPPKPVVLAYFNKYMHHFLVCNIPVKSAKGTGQNTVGPPRDMDPPQIGTPTDGHPEICYHAQY